MTTPNTKTRRVFHYAEVLKGETHEELKDGYRCFHERKTCRTYSYRLGVKPRTGVWIPVNRLPETTEVVAPSNTKIPFPENGMPPRTERIRIVFEDEIRSTQAFPDAKGRHWYLRPDGEIISVKAGGEIPWNSIPLQRAETRTPAPAPRTRTRVVFEECDEADWKGDAMGRWWYQPKGTVKIVYSTYELPAEKGIVYFNRTEEVITVDPPKPERWRGTASISSSIYARVEINDGDISFAGVGLGSQEKVAADIPRLKALAETYADQHGATIEWEESK